MDASPGAFRPGMQRMGVASSVQQLLCVAPGAEGGSCPSPLWAPKRCTVARSPVPPTNIFSALAPSQQRNGWIGSTTPSAALRRRFDGVELRSALAANDGGASQPRGDVPAPRTNRSGLSHFYRVVIFVGGVSSCSSSLAQVPTHERSPRMGSHHCAAMWHSCGKATVVREVGPWLPGLLRHHGRCRSQKSATDPRVDV